MTDSWARPSGSNEPDRRGPEATVEIELEGPRPARGAAAEVGGAGRPPTNWRRLVAAAGLAGVLLGIVVAVVVVNSGGDEEAGPTTVDRGAIAGRITAPPTIAIEAPPTVAPTLPDAPIGVGTDAEFAPIELTPTDPPADLSDGDFALAPVDDDLPVAASIEFGATGAPSTALSVVEYEPLADRARLAQGVAEAVDGAGTEIDIDLRARLAYVPLGDGTWRSVRATDLFPDLGVGVRTFFAALSRGPVREATLAEVVTVGTSPDYFRIDDGTIVRRYSVQLPIDALPERLVFGGPDASVVDITVYVDRLGQPVLTEAVNDEPQGIVWIRHRRLPGTVPIELPDPSTVVETANDPTTDAPATSVPDVTAP